MNEIQKLKQNQHAFKSSCSCRIFDSTSCKYGAGCPYLRHTFHEYGSKLFLYFRLFKNCVSYFDYVILAMRFKSAKL